MADSERNSAEVAFDAVADDDRTHHGSAPELRTFKDVESTNELPTILLDSNLEFPDGGFRAWLVVFGAMCVTFTTFGFVNSWGVFQSYYQQTLLTTSSPSSLAWIGSVQYSLVFLPGLFAGRLFDRGYDRAVLLCSSALLVTATFLVAECKVYWQFLLCQGFAVGLGCGGMMNPTLAVIGHWFKKRRGIAMGMTAVGSSIGGTLIPIASRLLITRVGFPWTMRIIGFISIFTLTLANLFVRRRLAPQNVSGGLFNWRAFKSAPFSVYCASSFVNFLGVYTLLIYIDISAASVGINPDLSFYLVAIANAASGLGRFVAGHLADRFGPMNIMIPFTAAAGIITYAWPFARTAASLIVVAVLYGFASGSYVSLLTNPVMEFGETADIGRRVGMMMSILALGGLAGPPISGAINSATGGFEAVGYYAGSAVLVGVGLMCWVRYMVLKRLYGKM
ncbi:major facilitator superfamily domain-containing protein [Mycena floridula]|nr:major facilitator superfamily domain-containing protein [Mycena floridula]